MKDTKPKNTIATQIYSFKFQCKSDWQFTAATSASLLIHSTFCPACLGLTLNKSHTCNSHPGGYPPFEVVFNLGYDCISSTKQLISWRIVTIFESFSYGLFGWMSAQQNTRHVWLNMGVVECNPSNTSIFYKVPTWLKYGQKNLVFRNS